MSTDRLACIILAAGDGTRLKSRVPKALHHICGRPMLYHVIQIAQQVAAAPTVIVVGYQGEQIQEAVNHHSDIQFAWQRERKGTGHAAMCACEELVGFTGDLLVMAGDTPLLTTTTIQQLIHRHRHQAAAASLLTTNMDDPTGYGRLLRYDDNTVQGIVEHKDANRYERAIAEINVGTYLFKAEKLFMALEQLRPDNAQQEYYLTDVIRILVDADERVEAVTTEDWQETIGVNNRLQLADAEEVLRNRIRTRHMLEGVTMLDPATIRIDDMVGIGQDTIISPRVDLLGTTTIGRDCQIDSGCYLHNATIGDGCMLGPQTAVVNATVASGKQTEGFQVLRG